MINKIKYINLYKYQYTYIYIITLFFLLNLDQFLFATHIGPAPKYWIIAATATTIIFNFTRLNKIHTYCSPIIIWLAGYLVISIFWTIIANDTNKAIDVLAMVATTCLFIIIAFLSFEKIDQSDPLWGLTLWFALILSTSSILFDFFNPFSSIFSEAGNGIIGRAAGIYLNPNNAAQTLTLILLCIIARNQSSQSIIAALIATAGVLFTFSRGGLLSIIITILLATFHGKIKRWFLILISIIFIITLLLGDLIVQQLLSIINSDNKDIELRIAWLLGQASLDDFSDNSRREVAAESANRYLNAPILGHGLGDMFSSQANLGTHNLLLRHMTDYGLIGMFIFPLFIVASIKSRDLSSSNSWPIFAGIPIIFLSLFSHNMLEQANFVLPWLAICLISPSKKRY